MQDSIPAVTYAGRCMVLGQLSGHLVVQGQYAPVTVFLIPNEQVKQSSRFLAGTLNASITPVPRGTIAVVGSPGELLEVIEKQVIHAVRWPT